MFELASVTILFGLTSAVAWGIADFFIGRVAKALGSVRAALLVNGIEAGVFGLLYLLFFWNSTWTSQGVMYALIGSVFFGAAQGGFFKAMRLGPVGLVSSISSTYPLVALVVGVALFAVGVSLVDTVGIVLIVSGVMVASGLFERTKHLGKGPLIALLPALGWGAGLGFISQAFTMMPWQNVFLIELVTAPIVLAALTPFIKGNEKITSHTLLAGVGLPIIWLAGILQMTGLLALNLGMSFSPAESAIAIAVSSCYPALTIFLALRHLDEKIPVIPLIGGIIGVVGVVVLALG